ncbi:hypothetical protein [Leifsonia sp. NPDC058230]|uniref:hypothetical protein n=1 Tax=Leifsonia sp. NPDC058230 TaxID=3346391 RepID=UPI0036DD212E
MSQPTPPRTHDDQHLLNGCGGVMCAESGAGHELSFLQRRVASATPSKWRDAVVTLVLPDGWVQLTTIDDQESVWVWQHSDLTGALHSGEPVALHEVYHVLAAGSHWLNVAPASNTAAAATAL